VRDATFVTALALLLTPAWSRAQEAPSRRDLLVRAEAASREGQHADALALAEAAGRMQMTPSVRMFLAEEHEALAEGGVRGRHLLDAAAMAQACVRDANAQPTLNNRDRILARCTVLLQRLNARIARVRVVVAATPPAGTEVRLDERRLTDAEWNTPIEVLPGESVVEARSPDGRVFRQTVRLAAEGSATVTVRFSPVALTSAPGALADRPPAASPVWPRVVGWSLVGVGAVGVALGVWQWGVSRSLADDAEHGTGASGEAWARYATRVNPADERGARRYSITEVCVRADGEAATDADARGAATLCEASGTARTLGFALGVGGAVLAGVGAVVLAVAPRAATARVAVAPWVERGLSGAVVGGRF
jgi:hypothetical protein